MNKLKLSGLTCAALLMLPEMGMAHGGQYRGPGDVVPPNTGGGGPRTGGPGAPGPSTPGPSTPGAPAPAGPTTPGPGAPPGPATGGPGAPGPGGGPTTGGGIVLSDDLGKWVYWWEFNKDPFINLKDAIHAANTVTGSADVFLGGSRRVDSKNTIKPSEADIQEVILPALKRALESTDNRDINSSCIIAMAKIGKDHKDFQILPIIKGHLVTPDQEIRETAALAMGIFATPSGIEDLSELATDSPKGRKMVERPQVDNRTRSFAAYGLGLIAYANNDIQVKTQAFKALKKVLADEKSSDRNIKVAAINSIALLNLNRGDENEKKLLNEALTALDAYFDKKAGRGDDLMKSHVAPAIAKLIGRGTEDIHEKYKARFLKQLNPRKKRGNDIYRGAALALGQLCLPQEDHKSDAKYSKALLTFADKGKDEQSRSFCMLALGQIGGPKNRTALLKLLAKGNKATVRPWAALSLGVMQHERFEANKNAPVDTTLGQALIKQLNGIKNPATVGAIAVALGLCRYKDAAPNLVDMLIKKKHQNELAGYLCLGLALMNHTKSTDDIHQIVKTSVRRPELLRQAAVALGKLGDKRVATTLTEMLKEGDTNLAKMSAIASALGFIGDRRTIPPLKDMLFNESLTPLSRAFAAVALGGVADKEKLPWNSKIARNINYRAAVETLTQSGTGVLDIL